MKYKLNIKTNGLIRPNITLRFLLRLEKTYRPPANGKAITTDNKKKIIS